MKNRNLEKRFGELFCTNPQSCAAFVAFCNANLLKVMMIINITQLSEIDCGMNCE